MQKTKPLKLTGKRSMASKLRRISSELENDAERMNGSPNWQVRFKLRTLSGEMLDLAHKLEGAPPAPAEPQEKAGYG